MTGVAGGEFIAQVCAMMVRRVSTDSRKEEERFLTAQPNRPARARREEKRWAAPFEMTNVGAHGQGVHGGAEISARTFWRGEERFLATQADRFAGPNREENVG